MPATLTHDEVTATLKRLEKKDPGLKRLLQKAHGYAVFPSVGKAAVVLGGSYGRGEVFEKGKFIGHATIAQFTVGVQLGGDTFAEVIVFETKPALDRFKQGKMAFAANASAVLVKAGAAAANNFNRGVAVFAYSEGGMLLEAAIGGQKFKFKPAGQPDSKKGQGQEQSKSGKSGKGQQGRAEASDEGEEEEQSEDEGAEEDEGDESDESGDGAGFMGRALGGVKDAASSVGGMAKQHPVYATIIGAGLVTGLAMMIARSVRGSSGGADEDEGSDGQEEESEDENEGPEASGEDEGEDSGEEEEQNGDGDEEEDEPRFMKRGRARA